MKKALSISGFVFTLMSCGNSDNTNSVSTDTLGTSPGAIEQGTQHPTGVTNQNVISTDTAAMNVEKMSDTTGNQ